MLELSIINEYDSSIEPQISSLTEFVINVSKYLDVDYDAEMAIIICDDKKIHEINKEYRGVDKVTDVISFAYQDDVEGELKIINNVTPVILGDIYISYDTMKRQAKNYGHSEKRELYFLTVHGLLHLLGYDHMNEIDEQIMFKKQDEVLAHYEITR